MTPNFRIFLITLLSYLFAILITSGETFPIRAWTAFAWTCLGFLAGVRCVFGRRRADN